MLRRERPPHRGLWNGLGGKIEPGEPPLRAVRREVLEESGLDLDGARRLRYAGVVTWEEVGSCTTVGTGGGSGSTYKSGGMYTFIAELTGETPLTEDRDSEEGLLGWRPLAWVCDPENPAVVGNIPRFLPPMLSDEEPAHYHCEYRAGAPLRVLKSGIEV